jgi:hypothetical protein
MKINSGNPEGPPAASIEEEVTDIEVAVPSRRARVALSGAGSKADRDM